LQAACNVTNAISESLVEIRRDFTNIENGFRFFEFRERLFWVVEKKIFTGQGIAVLLILQERSEQR